MGVAKMGQGPKGYGLCDRICDRCRSPMTTDEATSGVLCCACLDAEDEGDEDRHTPEPKPESSGLFVVESGQRGAARETDAHYGPFASYDEAEAFADKCRDRDGSAEVWASVTEVLNPGEGLLFVRRDVLCGCGWGSLAAPLSVLVELERDGCPTCGGAFSVDEGWI